MKHNFGFIQVFLDFAQLVGLSWVLQNHSMYMSVNISSLPKGHLHNKKTDMTHVYTKVSLLAALRQLHT